MGEKKSKRFLHITAAIFLTAAVIALAVFIGKGVNPMLLPHDSSEISLENRYYYERLSPKEKEAYIKVEENIQKMRRIIVLPNDMDLDSVNNALEAYRADVPFSALIAVDKMNFVDSKIGNHLKISYLMTKEEYRLKERELNNKIESIVNCIPQELTNSQKELFVHDYIVNNTQYKITKEKLGNTAYGALVEKQSACVGYAQATKLILNKLNIECITVCGEAEADNKKEKHMWNQVKIDGDWYNLDATWDDAVGETQTLTRKFFNVSDEDIKNTHIPFNETNECTAVSKNYFVENGLLFDSYNEETLKKIIPLLANAKSSEPLEIRFTDKNEYKRACKSLTDKDIFESIPEIEKINSKKVDLEKTGIIRCDDLNIIEFLISYK